MTLLLTLTSFKFWPIDSHVNLSFYLFIFFFSVLDSSTKLPDGILAGNTFQLGHFDECLSVGVLLPGTDRKLRGQYCLAEVEYSPMNLEIDSHRDDSAEIDLFNTSAWHHIKVNTVFMFLLAHKTLFYFKYERKLFL